MGFSGALNGTEEEAIVIGRMGRTASRTAADRAPRLGTDCHSAASVTASSSPGSAPNFLGKGAYTAASTDGIAANITMMK